MAGVVNRPNLVEKGTSAFLDKAASGYSNVEKCMGDPRLAPDVEVEIFLVDLRNKTWILMGTWIVDLKLLASVPSPRI